MTNTYIILGAIITLGGLAGLMAYLYREGALASGKTEIGLGPLKLKLNAAPRPDGEAGDEPAARPPAGEKS